MGKINTTSMILIIYFANFSSHAQTNNILIEACNGIASETKRQDCLRAASAAIQPDGKLKTQSIPKSDGPPPFSVDVAAASCEVLMGSMVKRRKEALEDASESTNDVMFITWPTIDDKPQVYCGVDRQSRKVVSIGKGAKAITGAKLAELIVEHEFLTKIKKEISEGDYANFLNYTKTALTKNFKDPSSAQYRSLYISGDSMPTLCGEVNAKNSYGAYIGYRRFYATGYKFLNEVETPSEKSVFEAMWPTMCGDKKVNIN